MEFGSPPTMTPEEALRQHDTYEALESSPETIETHISRLYLTADLVFKQKKPVDLGFVDFSTLEKRHEACQAEVAINRRLAPDVYLGVVGIGRNEKGDWRIGSDVPAEDWLVKMRRLPQERCLQDILEGEGASDADAQQVIQMLAPFYRQLQQAHRDAIGNLRDQGDASYSGHAYIDAIAHHIRDNRKELMSLNHGLDPLVAEKTHAAQAQYLFIHREMFGRRVAQGHVVEGHGDLRADHVYLTDPPVCIDAIEFSRELRTVDVADELCFFALSCEMVGAADFGQRVMVGVLRELPDFPPDSLLDFYRSYRACVRAKVAAIRTLQVVGNAEQTTRRESEHYLEVASGYASRLGSPLAVLVRGVSGSGKSSTAQQLADAMGARWLSTDQIRQLQSVEADQRYTVANRAKVYEAMLHEADAMVRQGLSVVLDGTFLSGELLREAGKRVQAAGAPLTVVTCVCPEQIAMQRIQQRAASGQTLSEADAQVLQEQLQRIEAVPAELDQLDVDSTQSLSEILDQIAAHLAQKTI